jgi:ubiquitin fusion degradation protein 1
MDVSYPLMFSVENEADSSQHATHCGVLEFSAPEGTVYLPLWVMKSIGVRSGDFVTLRNVTLPLGTFVKLQPQSVAFLDITDPRAVLEHSFRAFSALTRGDMIQIGYNEQIYELLIMEIKPASAKHAISIVETDLQVDFAAPVGYVEPAPVAPAAEKSIAGSLGAHNLSQAATGSPSGSLSSSFKPFSGTGCSLKATSADTKGPNIAAPSAPTGPMALKLPPGMLFFGSKKGDQERDKEKADDPKQAPAFKAFSGTGNKLR